MCLTWSLASAWHLEELCSVSCTLRQKVQTFVSLPISLWLWAAFRRREYPLRRRGFYWLKVNQPWILIGRTDAEAQAPIFWPHDVKSRLIGNDPDAWRYWGQEEKGTTEDEMVGWHHQLNGHEFEHTSGNGEGQGSLACCSPWGGKVRHNLAAEQQQQQFSRKGATLRN